ncbi:MAG: hypothetical protein QM817_19455 [Archangium sp.]
MTLSWKSLVSVAKAAIEPPPVGSLISTYALDVTGDGTPLYYCEPDDDAHGAELWAFDGKWSKLHEKRLPRIEELEGGGWDPTREGFCVFGFDFAYPEKRWVPHGYAVGLDGKQSELKFSGDFPVIADEEISAGTFDVRAAFAFDHSRSVWVAFTRFGIWELDAAGAWSKRRERGTDSWPTDWSNETGTAFYDPLGKRTVFWLQDSEEYDLQVWTWDGSSLGSIPVKGLPKLTHGLFDPSCQLGGHPKHGVLLQLESQVWAFEGTKWVELPAKGNGPPRMQFARSVFSEKHGWLVGPAQHQKGGNQFQRVFFVLKDGEWSAQGVVHTPSPLASSGYGKVLMGFCDGAWIATSTTSLRTWRLEGEQWKELIDDKAGETIIGREQLTLVGDGKRLWAVNTKGAIAEFTGDSWKALRKGDAAFKERREFAAAFDPQGRLVVWGGEVKNRKQNDTLILENGKWRVVKKASPQPSDFKHGKDGTYVDFQMLFDSTLGRMVRFGFDDLALQQDDETWAAVKPKGYTKAAISSRAWGHFPAHDPESGETLLVDFENARIVRFDLAGVTEVEKIEWPAALLPKKQHDTAAHHLISESFAYDPKSKTISAADLNESTSLFSLDLTPVFAKAKALGARKTLGPAKTAKAGAEKRIAYRIGKSGNVETAVAPKAGFVTADALDATALKALVGVPAEVISIAKKGAVTKSRLGGPAPAVAAKKWPKVGKAPMGFLFQLETGALLKKYAGVAVFCALDGEATTEEDHNAVVLLKAADLAKTAKPPAGVAELPSQPITFSAMKVEIDEARAVALGEKDASLAQVLEKFGSSKDVQQPSAQKRGGVPVFLQGEMKMKGWKFVAQLDFDSLNVSKTWPEAGLAGCVYVFVKNDEKDAFAVWQYT